jgi:hypothetical protein
MLVPRDLRKRDVRERVVAGQAVARLHKGRVCCGDVLVERANGEPCLDPRQVVPGATLDVVRVEFTKAGELGRVVQHHVVKPRLRATLQMDVKRDVKRALRVGSAVRQGDATAKVADTYCSRTVALTDVVGTFNASDTVVTEAGAATPISFAPAWPRPADITAPYRIDREGQVWQRNQPVDLFTHTGLFQDARPIPILPHDVADPDQKKKDHKRKKGAGKTLSCKKQKVLHRVVDILNDSQEDDRFMVRYRNKAGDVAGGPACRLHHTGENWISCDGVFATGWVKRDDLTNASHLLDRYERPLPKTTPAELYAVQMVADQFFPGRPVVRQGPRQFSVKVAGGPAGNFHGTTLQNALSIVRERRVRCDRPSSSGRILNDQYLLVPIPGVRDPDTGLQAHRLEPRRLEPRAAVTAVTAEEATRYPGASLYRPERKVFTTKDLDYAFDYCPSQVITDMLPITLQGGKLVYDGKRYDAEVLHGQWREGEYKHYTCEEDLIVIGGANRLIIRNPVTTDVKVVVEVRQDRSQLTNLAGTSHTYSGNLTDTHLNTIEYFSDQDAQDIARVWFRI